MCTRKKVKANSCEQNEKSVGQARKKAFSSLKKTLNSWLRETIYVFAFMFFSLSFLLLLSLESTPFF